MVRTQKKEKDSEKGKKGKSQERPKPESPRGRKVEFIFQAPESDEVFLVGDFNVWDMKSMPMSRGKEGIWRREISLLPGRYEYKVLVGNSWSEDRSCTVMVENSCIQDVSDAQQVANAFGTCNFVLKVN